MKINTLLSVLTGLIVFSGVTPLSNAATYSIDSMNITGGSFQVSTGTDLISNPDFGSTTTPLTFIGPNTNLVDGYIGDNTGTNSIAATTWFSLDVYAYTASSNPGDTSTPAGSIAGGPVPSGQLDNTSGTIELDLSAWFVNWSSFDEQSGTGKSDGLTSSIAAGTWDPDTGDYTLNWNSGVSLDLCTPSSGTNCVAYWTLEGNASPSIVPVPAAVWLFASGLIGLLSLTKTDKKNTAGIVIKVL